MERKKAERAVIRRKFTLSANDLEDALNTGDTEPSCISALLEKLEYCYDQLRDLNNTILTLWLDDATRDEKAMQADLDSSDAYEKRWFLLKHRATPALTSNDVTKDSKGSVSSEHSSTKSRRHRIKLPKIELPTFDGQIKQWIAFWSQFDKIHSSDELTDDEKFHYLLQCMEKGSSAREMIESFPPCGKNYANAVECLKERFAKEEFIIDYYVRELLQLVISKSVTKLSTTALFDKIMTQIMALESLGLTQDKFASFLYPLVESALPDEVLRAWNRSQFQKENKDKPLSKLLQFLKLEVESEERIHAAKFSSFSHASSTQCNPSTSTCLTTSVKKENTKDSTDKIEEKKETCIWCTKSFHSSSECNSAMRMDLDQRKEFLKKNRACLICLKKGHIAKNCRKYPKCLVCSKRHFTLMCSELNKSAAKTSSVEMNSKDSQKEVLSQNVECSTVLLQTLKVKISKDDKEVTVRALLDSGAQRTFIKRDVAEQLKLTPIGEQSLSHNLFGGNVTKKYSHKLYEFKIASLDGTYSCDIKALEQPILCGFLPQLKQGSIIKSLQERGISLTDCVGDKSEIGLLIGSDILGTLLTGRLERVDDRLVAMQTKLGWTIQGPTVGVFACSDNNLTTLHASCNYDNIEDFWRLETLGIRDEAEVKSRQTAESEVQVFFKDTVRRDSENRYEVRLPWKAKCLESNYDLALKRLTSTTTRLSRLGIMKDYDEVFREWLESGIIEEVDDSCEDIRYTGHYLSHHAVIRESSLTTKIRPVFNASANDKNGFSLNSCLEKGVNLIELIPSLLMQFRRNEIGITADIKKAFLQISLHPEDRQYLKFLWWRDIEESPRVIKTFRHRRVVFGVTTSPYLLSATILHHLENFSCKTAALLRKSFYVDNCVVSVKSVEDLHQFVREAKEIMLDGGFELRCWVSGPELIDSDILNISVLGLNWDPRRDVINCKSPSVIPEKLTKRTLLSIAQSTFDPLGFLSPATIVPKLLIQKCWTLNLDWDQALPLEIEKPAAEWLRHISYLGSCELPRRISLFNLEKADNSLHVFCDGSQAAYACCIFLRSEFEKEVSVQLVLAKSRVAPSKGVTIPRLELLAALLASRLICEVRNSLELSCKEFYWTDSSIVLAWLKKQTNCNVFVNNRVREILSKTSVDNWRHISGDMNPADFPSRGCNPKVLFESSWWLGPGWLKSSNFPISTAQAELDIESKDELVATVQSDDSVNKCNFSDRLSYFSKYSKIVRTLGWCLRFVNNCKKSVCKVKGDILAEEYKVAEKRLFQVIQSESFINIVEIRKKLRLDIFEDVDNILRVKTRLSLADDNSTDDFISPILLPGKHIIVERLVFHRHRELLHAGSQTLLSKLRETVWIVGGRVLAKRIVRNCMVCKRFGIKSCRVPVPPLPADRIRCGAPFQVSGVDFAGPLFLRSGEKCWIALFTCAVYRAVHLELCLSLSTEEFLLALRRFIARRGNVQIMYSDNGTNFRGAHNVLSNLNWEEIQVKANRLVWHFSPPSAPWWGGFWERMVRSVKELLRRVLGRASLNFNELFTVLCEVESVVNERPLTATDDTELKILTPASFLLPCRTDSKIDIEVIDGRILTSRWRYLTKLCSDLKSRFKNEYLGLITQKQHKGRHVNVKVGDVVIVESDKKRVEWPLGIVKEVFEGSDGSSRVARVKTADGLFLRAVQNLYPLELSAVRDIPQGVTTRSGRLVVAPTRLGVGN